MSKQTIKKQVEIEKLLQWAYLDELPKRQISSAEGIWDGIAEWGQRGGIDVGQGAAQRYPHFGLPHPDAEAIEVAVGALGLVGIENGFDVIVGELASLVSINDLKPRRAIRVEGHTTKAGYYDEDTAPPAFAPRDVILVRSINAAALVTMHAVMRTRPDWTSAEPRPHAIPAAHGRGVKIVGRCRAKNLYTEGSYCPLRWLPSPIDVVLGRADYHVWHQSLVRLSQTLVLAAHEALPPAASAAPWREAEKPARVHAYAVARQRPLPLKPPRDHVALPPKKTRSNKGRSLLLDAGAKT
jgi:hypothetical protein